MHYLIIGQYRVTFWIPAHINNRVTVESISNTRFNMELGWTFTGEEFAALLNILRTTKDIVKVVSVVGTLFGP